MASPTRTVKQDDKVTEEEYIAPKVTVGFERSISVKPYETEKFSMFMPVDVPLDGNDTDFDAAVREAAAVAKATVYQQLGLDNQLDPQTGVVVQLLKKTVDAEAVETVPKAKARASSKPTAALQPKSNGTTQQNTPQNTAGADEALWKDLANNPEKWFDNRNDKRNPKAPDFKRKGTGEGLWLDSRSNPVPDWFDVDTLGE